MTKLEQNKKKKYVYAVLNFKCEKRKSPGVRLNKIFQNTKNIVNFNYL